MNHGHQTWLSTYRRLIMHFAVLHNVPVLSNYGEIFVCGRRKLLDCNESESKNQTNFVLELLKEIS